MGVFRFLALTRSRYDGSIQFRVEECDSDLLMSPVSCSCLMNRPGDQVGVSLEDMQQPRLLL